MAQRSSPPQSSSLGNGRMYIGAWRRRLKFESEFLTMKFIILTLASIFLSFACLAQQIITNGNIRIIFPSADWNETNPPHQMLQALDDSKTPLKLIFHAVSTPSKLRFYITQFDYPPIYDTNMAKFLADYLAGVRDRCSRQASGEVIERQDHIGNLPVKIFEAKLPNGLFLEIRTVFCAGRLYSLEMGGSVDSKAAAEQCLNGVSFVEENPIATSLMNRILQMKPQFTQMTTAYQQGKKEGYVFGAVLTGLFIISAVVIILVSIFRGAAQKKRTIPPKLPK